MRIYVLSPSFPPTEGGQEKHLLELSQSLIDAGAEVRVLTRRAEPGFKREEMLGSVRVVRFSPFGEIRGVGLIAAPRLGLLLLKMIWRLVCDAGRYDVVLVSGFNFMPMSAIIAAVLTRKPVVVRPESPLEVSEPLGTQSRKKMALSEKSRVVRILAWLRRSTANRVGRFVAISSEIRECLIRVGVDARRIVSIPNGIDSKRFEPLTTEATARLRAALSLPADGLILIYTGRLALSKGVMSLLELWAEIRSEFPTGRLLIVGTGKGSFDNCESEMRAFVVAHDLSSSVTMTGSVGNVNEYLQVSDLFVFPSDYEGFSLSILEAMTAGLPMVSTRVGLAAELEDRGRFGLLVPPKDKMAFRDALRRLLADAALRSEMGTTARALVSEQYSTGAEARRYLQLFTELMESS
jgi:glycosyltransferase involved in cell wall biosynthesis